MQKLSNLWKVIIVGVGAAILIVLTIVYATSTGSQNPVADNSANPALTANSPTQTPGISGSTTTVEGGSVVTVVAGPSASGPVIKFVTPIKADIWKIGTQNLISWNKAGNFSGSLSLINASTGAFVGTILPEIGPQQTSYAWNTRDLMLTRTDPLKKDVVPGVYEVRIAYDGNNIKPVTSPAFTITN